MSTQPLRFATRKAAVKPKKRVVKPYIDFSKVQVFNDGYYKAPPPPTPSEAAANAELARAVITRKTIELHKIYTGLATQHKRQPTRHEFIKAAALRHFSAREIARVADVSSEVVAEIMRQGGWL